MHNTQSMLPKGLKWLSIAVALTVLVILLIVNFGKQGAAPPTTTSEQFGEIPVMDLHGIVMGIQGSAITMEVSSILGMPLTNNSSLKMRKVFVKENTSIFELIPKEPEVYARELAADKKAKASGGFRFGPSNLTERKLNLSDLKVGDNISVREADMDLKYKTEIQASQIIKN